MLTEELSHMLQRLSCSDFHGKSFSDILIKEHDQASTIKNVHIKNIDEGLQKDWFSFDPDRGRLGGTISNILTESVNQNHVVGTAIKDFYHHKACDQIMVINNNGKLHIIYIELKCGATGYTYQFKSSQCLVRYIVNICNMIGGKCFEIEKERFIVFHAVPGLNSKSLSYQSQIENIKKSKPDKPHKIFVSGSTKELNFSAIYV